MKKFTVSFSQKAQKSMLCISFSLMTMILLLFFATPAKSQYPTSVVYSGAGAGSFTFNGSFPSTPVPSFLRVHISSGTGAGSYFDLTVYSHSTTVIVTSDSSLNATSVASIIQYLDASHNALSGWTTCSTNTPLPVKISSVGAKVEGTKTVINWVTSTEVNNDRFEIQRTLNNSDFVLIGTVKGAGNSNQNLRYEFIDNTPIKGCRYRLKQIDFNGEFEYSRIIIPEASTELDGKIEMIVRPNPSNSSALVTVNLNNTDLSSSNLMVTDAYGRVVFQTIFENTGSPLELPNLATGLYTITAFSGNLVLNKRLTVLNE
jgi:hypothetical protein